jgi:Ca2+-binding RTX toxin-like protein
MARIDISNQWGYGLDMSDYTDSGWGYIPADRMTGTLYPGSNTIVFDAYGYASFDSLGFNYFHYDDGDSVLIEDIYYFQGNDPVLTLDDVDILTTIEDLNAPAWYVRFNQGNDSFYGNDFADVVKGGYGNDLIVGYAGNDTLYGNDDNDSLGGGAGNDLIQGGRGNDLIYGGTGKDRLYGSSGKDIFVFDTKPSATSNKDPIYDFNVRDDTIRIDNSVFTKVGGNGALKSGAFWASTSGKAHDSSDRIIYDKDGGQLYYDADGSGKGAAVQIAQLSKKLAMTYKDLYVI